MQALPFEHLEIILYVFYIVNVHVYVNLKITFNS